MNLSVACPFCPARFVIPVPDGTDTLYGFVDAADTGCASVTMPTSPECSEHMLAHARDGSDAPVKRSIGEAFLRRAELVEGL